MLAEELSLLLHLLGVVLYFPSALPWGPECWPSVSAAACFCRERPEDELDADSHDDMERQLGTGAMYT